MKKIFILILISIFSCKNESICTINENNAGKEIYDLDEATCFIALKLNKKKPDLNLIRGALIAEEAWIEKIELISNKPLQEDGIDPIAELDIHDLVEFVFNNYNTELTKMELLEIFEVETGYLEFIEVVVE